MIEWKDAKEVLAHATRSVVMLDKHHDILNGYYCNKQNMFFYTCKGEDYPTKDVTHWDYFEYPL